MEEWRQYRDTQYQISNLGRVKGWRGKLLSLRKNSNGYLRVGICNGKDAPKDAYVSRMVAETFIGPPPFVDWHADHIDRNITNNSVQNLRWIAPKDNRALRHIAKGSKSGVSKLTEDQVMEIRSRPRSKFAAAVIASEFKVSPRQVRDIINRKLWRHI